MAEKGSYAKQVIETFEFLMTKPYGVTIDEVAKHLDVHKTTAARLMRAFEKAGILEWEWESPKTKRTPTGQFVRAERNLPGRKRYRVSPEELGRIYRANRRVFDEISSIANQGRTEQRMKTAGTGVGL
jgi:DNA-binding MarR family transcriptional regulator